MLITHNLKEFGKSKSVLYVIGLSGSGKSTTSQFLLSKYPKAKLISLDNKSYEEVNYLLQKYSIYEMDKKNIPNPVIIEGCSMIPHYNCTFFHNNIFDHSIVIPDTNPFISYKRRLMRDITKYGIYYTIFTNFNPFYMIPRYIYDYKVIKEIKDRIKLYRQRKEEK